MPKRKSPEPDPGAFERMARELGCDETGEAFERALAQVLPPRKAAGPADGGREIAPVETGAALGKAVGKARRKRRGEGVA